jgi:hypothetical protein
MLVQFQRDFIFLRRFSRNFRTFNFITILREDSGLLQSCRQSCRGEYTKFVILWTGLILWLVLLPAFQLQVLKRFADSGINHEQAPWIYISLVAICLTKKNRKFVWKHLFYWETWGWPENQSTLKVAEVFQMIVSVWNRRICYCWGHDSFIRLCQCTEP